MRGVGRGHDITPPGNRGGRTQRPRDLGVFLKRVREMRNLRILSMLEDVGVCIEYIYTAEGGLI